jgi:hypothetical protein
MGLPLFRHWTSCCGIRGRTVIPCVCCFFSNVRPSRCPAACARPGVVLASIVSRRPLASDAAAAVPCAVFMDSVCTVIRQLAGGLRTTPPASASLPLLRRMLLVLRVVYVDGHKVFRARALVRDAAAVCRVRDVVSCGSVRTVIPCACCFPPTCVLAAALQRAFDRAWCWHQLSHAVCW